MTAIIRRCGCRDEQGKTYGTLPVKSATDQQKSRACPAMLSNPKHGTYSWRLSRGFDPVTGKRVQVNGGSFPTLKAAQVALNKAKVGKDEGTLATPTAVTLASYAADWLPRRQTTGKRPLAQTTAAQYRAYIDADIAPSRIGRMKLSDIRRSDVTAFLDGLMKAGRGPTTVNRILAVVMSALTGAVRDELIPVNVARGIEGPSVTRTEIEIWSPDQLAAFLDVAAEHRLGPAFELAVHTALRRGELCGLRWSDVDMDRGVVQVRNNRVLVGGTTVAEVAPKTASSAAEVELSRSALGALQVWQLRQDMERQEFGDLWQGDGHVFTYADGRALSPAYVTRLFEKLRVATERKLRDQQAEELAATGMTKAEVDAYMSTKGTTLPRLTLHGLRHIAATYMWTDGADVLAVSRALRHSSPGVTAQVYTHLVGGKQRATFEGVETMLRSSTAHTLHAHAAE